MFKSLTFLFKGLLVALFVDFWPAIKRFFRLLWKAIWTFFHRRHKGHVVNPAQCVPINNPSFKKPDPLIYDQYYLMSLGIAVSWQNPDIQILQGGVPVTSAYNLLPSSPYTIRARIWNGSTEGVCAGMPVVFSYLSFGVGTVSHPIGTTSVNLGVKGSALSPAYAEMGWITPPSPGHYCIQVSFAWADDLNPNNNLGQENTQVVKAASPAPFLFALRNAADVRREFRFEVDTFQLAPPPLCNDFSGRGNPPRLAAAGRLQAAAVPVVVRTRNSREANPLPAGWTITFNPSTPVLAPGQEIEIAAVVNPDSGFHGSLPVNVHTFSGTELVGGITILVQRT